MGQEIISVEYANSDEPSHALNLTLSVQCLLFIGELIALAWLIQSLVSESWVEAACLGQFVLAMAGATAAIYSAGARRRRIYEPLDRLAALLPELRSGRFPIDELSKIGGAVAPIAREFQALLRDVRTEKAKVVEMESEVRQRIANRTDALERKIGSLQQQATRDVLTGLLNRRALNEHLSKVIEKCVKSGLQASVLMIDVDNFKPLNDTLGHAAGDELLRSIGQILRSTLREGDTAFRCGGDEFVVVLDGADMNGANALATRLTTLIDGLAKTMKVAAPPRLSIGAASLAEVKNQTAESLLEEADKRLYVVKGDRKRGSKPAALVTPPKTQIRKSA